MTTEKHDPWALLAEIHELQPWLSQDADLAARVDAALAEREGRGKAMTRLTRAELMDLVRRLVESLGDGGLSRTTVIEAERALRAEDAALTVDYEADRAFDALQPSLGAPVTPERRIRRQADVDAAFARGAEAMREAAMGACWHHGAMSLHKQIRALPDPEDKS